MSTMTAMSPEMVVRRMRDALGEFNNDELPVLALVQALAAYRRSHRAQPAQAVDVGNGWQPIETAPMDKVIDLCTLYRSGVSIRHTDCYWRPAGLWKEGWTSKTFDSEEGRVIDSPTHWMPPPASPTPDKEGL
jgi:hypothetical protein